MVYFISVIFIFTPYYNWKYATEHGFVKWLFLGEISATLKAGAWPYFVYFNKSENQSASFADTKSTAELSIAEVHLQISMKKSKEALLLINGDKANEVLLFIKGEKPLGKNEEQKFENFMVLIAEALTEAEQINFTVFQKAYTDMSDPVENLYLPSLRLLHDGLKNKDESKFIQGYKLMYDFMKYIKKFDTK